MAINLKSLMLGLLAFGVLGCLFVQTLKDSTDLSSDDEGTSSTVTVHTTVSLAAVLTDQQKRQMKREIRGEIAEVYTDFLEARLLPLTAEELDDLGKTIMDDGIDLSDEWMANRDLSWGKVTKMKCETSNKERYTLLVAWVAMNKLMARWKMHNSITYASVKAGVYAALCSRSLCPMPQRDAWYEAIKRLFPDEIFAWNPLLPCTQAELEAEEAL